MEIESEGYAWEIRRDVDNKLCDSGSHDNESVKDSVQEVYGEPGPYDYFDVNITKVPAPIKNGVY